jgi:UDP-glucose 4-epimerase
MTARRFLVTGGAGYVGSHCVLALRDRGDEVTVLDDLTSGHAAALPPGVRLVEAQVEDAATLDAVLADGSFHGVFHFAALSQVGESMAEPLRYFARNTGAAITLIEACRRHGIGGLVLSSTAAVYGEAAAQPIAEDTRPNPSSPYGESKRAVEAMLHWAWTAHRLPYAALRYFNAAGADPGGRAGEDHRPETHLIPLAIDAALGRRPPLRLFGTDWPTEDGTCIRDYVHVTDLAAAHLIAFDRLAGGPVTWNLGTGHGHSVRSVLAEVERAAGRPVPVELAPRRPGDPARLVAASARAQAAGWRPRHAALAEIVSTALDWRRSHPGGYGQC